MRRGKRLINWTWPPPLTTAPEQWFLGASHKKRRRPAETGLQITLWNQQLSFSHSGICRYLLPHSGLHELCCLEKRLTLHYSTRCCGNCFVQDENFTNIQLVHSPLLAPLRLRPNDFSVTTHFGKYSVLIEPHGRTAMQIQFGQDFRRTTQGWGRAKFESGLVHTRTDTESCSWRWAAIDPFSVDACLLQNGRTRQKKTRWEHKGAPATCQLREVPN